MYCPSLLADSNLGDSFKDYNSHILYTGNLPKTNSYKLMFPI